MSGRSNTTLGIEITADNSKAKAGLKDTAKDLDGVERSAKRTKASTSDLNRTLAGLAVVGAGKFVLDELEEAETTGRKTEAVIKSTGNAAEVSAAQQEMMVDALSKLAAVDDEVVAGGANILRTFTNIKGTEVFEGALNSAQDLVAVFGGDLSDKANLLGRALNDPAVGLSKLTRLGVTFTEQQKDQIKAMAEVGDRAGAQKVMLAVLEEQYGGQAEAAVTSSAKMKVAFANAAEELGTTLSPALTAAGAVAEKTLGILGDFPPVVQGGIVALGALGVAGAKLSEKFGDAGLSGSLGKSVGEVGALNTAVVGGIAGLTAYGATLDALNDSVAYDGDLGALATDLDHLGRGLADVDTLFGESAGGSGNLFAWSEKIKELRDTDFTFDDPLGAMDKSAANTMAALDDSLATLAQTNAPAAAAAVVKLGHGLEEYGITQTELIALLPAYGDALMRANRETAGVATATDNATQAVERNALALVQQAVAGAHSTVELAARRKQIQAEHDAERAVEAAHKATTSALDDQAEAHRAARGDSDEYRQSKEATADAEEALGDAQKSATETQAKLNEIRAEAAVRIRDMAEATREAREAERSDELAAREAEAKAKSALSDPKLTALERERAQLDAQEAKDQAGDSVNERIKAERDEAAAIAAGVEGDKAVVDAKEAVVDANEAVGDAARRVSDTVEASAAIIAQAKEDEVAASERVGAAIEAEGGSWEALGIAQGDATQGLSDHILLLQAYQDKLDPGGELYKRTADWIALLQSTTEGGGTPGGNVAAAIIALLASQPTTGAPSLGPAAPPGFDNTEGRAPRVTFNSTTVVQGTNQQTTRRFKAAVKDGFDAAIGGL